MAASAEAKDYVHLVTQALTEKSGAKPEILVKNIAEYERAHAGYDVAGKMNDALTFTPDLIILAIGENVPALKTPEEKSKFQSDVTQIYVNISSLSKDERYFARSERPFKHEGVANHPGDQGMAAIAAAIVKALPK